MVIEEIRKRLTAVPFVPFSVRAADGREYRVPTVDHIWLMPNGVTAAIATDTGGSAYLPVRHISGIVWEGNESHSATGA